MTWRELIQYIKKQDEEVLDLDIKVYNFETGEEFLADITELLYGEKERLSQSGWTPYLTINSEVDNGETKKTSIS